MASLPVTTAWSDPSASLTDGDSYVVQNKSSGTLQFYEGGTFDAAANDGDGVILVALHDGGSGNSDMRWTYSSANQVRMRISGGFLGATNTIEFAPAA